MIDLLQQQTCSYCTKIARFAPLWGKIFHASMIFDPLANHAFSARTVLQQINYCFVFCQIALFLGVLHTTIVLSMCLCLTLLYLVIYNSLFAIRFAPFADVFCPNCSRRITLSCLLTYPLPTHSWYMIW